MNAETECEVPGCHRPWTQQRLQRSGDIVRVCGQPHVFDEESARGVTEVHADRCASCGRRRDVHATNWFSRKHAFKEQEQLFDA